jgi:hypothetical protein
LRKTPYSLFESCRGWLDLQLSCSLLGQVLFKFLEIFTSKQCHCKFLTGRRRRGASARAPRPPRSQGPSRRPRLRLSRPWTLPRWARAPRHLEVPAAACLALERAPPWSVRLPTVPVAVPP